jgi:TP901 family phage tail tape measure protein
MALEPVGVSLVAEGGDQYLNTLQQAAAAETKLAAAAAPAVAGVNALDDASLAAAAAAQRMVGSYTDANGRLRDANGRFISAADAAAGLAHETAVAAGDAQALGAAAAVAGKGAEQLGKDSEKGGGGLNFLQQAAVGAVRQIGVLLTNAAAQAGRAILKFVGDTINVSGDFESGMNRFASVTGSALDESGQSLDQFKELFISLGRELPVSTAEVQQAAIEMAKGGIEPATIAAGGLRDVLNLAAAGEVSIAQAAEIASKQLGVWVDQSASATEKAAFLKDSVNLLSQAANASTVDVDDLALGLANSGKSADIAGLSFRETVTSMALISSGFSSAADAGTSFKTFLTRLQPTTDSQAAAFKNLNLLTAEGTSKFYDAQGAFIGMDKAAQLLQDSLKGMSAAQKSAALNAAFGADAIRTAGMLADAGADGYAHMAEEMAKAGSAAVQAAKKQQGFNVAVDNMMGSIEAFQITVGTAMLPILTKLINILASGINAITDYADATIKGETFLAKFASTAQTLAIPALTGVTAALVAYALVQTASAIPAIYESIPAIAAQAAAFYANAAAIMAALAPYALIAVAVGGVVLAYNDFIGKVQTATQELLNAKPWWEASTLAIEDYATQTGEAKKALEPYAATIQVLRDQIQGEVESLGQRMAAGMLSEDQYNAELKTIQAHRDGLVQVTAAYNQVSQALIEQTAHTMTATQRATELQGAESGLSEQTALTAKDIEDLGKKIEKTFQDGQDAVQKYATTYSEFATGVEQRSADHAQKIADLEAKKQDATTKEQKKGIDDQIAQVNQSYADQEGAAALSYARQQDAQKQHLGQMLIDYTVAQASLGNIAKDKAAEITAALEKEYGLQESSTATTFLRMAQHIDDSAKDSGGSIDGLIGKLRDEQQSAQDTQKAMDDYAKEYVATQTNNFVEGKQDADHYIESLERIPTQITTTVTTNYESHGQRAEDDQNPRHQGGGDDGGGKASGGSMTAMDSYIVGERGPEIVTPDTNSYVTPTAAIRNAMPSLTQLGGMRGMGGVSTQTIINVDARGSSLTVADITRGVQAGLAAEGRGADIRMRVANV